MSIAMDEARTYIGYGDITGPIVAWEDRDTAEAYIAGRTTVARPLEVEEAAYALWKTEVNMADLNPTGSEYTDAWGKLSKQQRDMYRSKARTVLEAARKAVSE